ncbi:SMP-30/gluconolactonase/LRE family protein [Reyranella sp.]|uniref:SMP-30/gluconolactonase/LRE family protein n=1 Tax=Reyranella sp. TaxID=1929291 RepID=UPI003BADB8D1
MDIVCVSSEPCDLGESLYWDARDRRLRWIDAWKAKVHDFDPLTGDIRTVDYSSALGGRPIGSVVSHAGGGLMAGVRGGFWRLDPNQAGATLVAAVEADRPEGNRLNDGKCDRAGRFWCASVNTDHQSATGALWCLEQGRAPVLAQDGLIVGNGIAWSPDDRAMYLADTMAGTVWRYEFDLASGAIANRQIFISTEHIKGVVDGATVDSDGCYWAALFRGSAVAQFDPEGKLMRHVRLPVANPTICGFGGADLDVLYVASASRFLDAERLKAQPLAGRVFAIHGLGCRGLPEPRFGT